MVGTATWNNTAKARRSSNVLVLNQEHPITQHVTSEIFPFGNITVSYNTIFGNISLVLDGKLVTMDLLCFYERRVEPEHWQAIILNVSLYSLTKVLKQFQ